MNDSFWSVFQHICQSMCSVHYALYILYKPKIANHLPILIGTLEGMLSYMLANELAYFNKF